MFFPRSHPRGGRQCPVIKNLIAAINRTNCETRMEDGKTLTELIAKKDALTLKLHLYKEIVRAGSQAAHPSRWPAMSGNNNE